MDGNGRIGRFLMNTMLASGGYPWTIIQMKHRTRYMKALEAADTERDFQPFARFIAEEMISTQERLEF
jgi:Fic family protein